MIKNEQGITLITLVVTVLMLIIITGTLVVNSTSTMQLSRLTKMQNDIEALDDRVAVYYVRTGNLPIYEDDKFTKDELISKFTNMRPSSSSSDYYEIDLDTLTNGNYYTIDISELDNLSLNYGKSYKSIDSTDKYIINEETHKIYYLKGIKYEGMEYHTVDL